MKGKKGVGVSRRTTDSAGGVRKTQVPILAQRVLPKTTSKQGLPTGRERSLRVQTKSFFFSRQRTKEEHQPAAPHGEVLRVVLVLVLVLELNSAVRARQIGRTGERFVECSQKT